MSQIIIITVLAYCLIGFAFAMFFSLRGVERVDAGAGASHWSFRIMIFPGAAALWPVMLIKWIKGETNV